MSTPLFDHVFSQGESKRPVNPGVVLRDQALKAVLENTANDYKARFEQAALSFNSPFTSEDVIEKVGMPTSHPSAVGALMRSLATRGLIYKTGKVVKARRPISHAAMLAEWVTR